MDKEMEQFQEDLLASVRQMKAGQAARVTETTLSPVASVRHAAGLTQARFAELMGVSVRTLQQWENKTKSKTSDFNTGGNNKTC